MEGVLSDERLQLPDELGASARPQVGLGPLHKRRQPELGEPTALSLGKLG